MFNRTLIAFSLLTFEKNHYQKLIKNIQDSRGYVSYIDSKKNSGYANKRYQKYLELKTALYNMYPKHAKNNQILIQLDESVNKKTIEKLYEEYGVQDDYFLEYETINYEDVKITKYTSVPYESKIFDNYLELDSYFENLNRDSLNEEFIMSGHRRFTLLPFQCQHDSKYIDSYIIANIYEIGVITLQLIINFEHDTILEVTDYPPRAIKLKKASFYKDLNEYKTKDFWEKQVHKEISPDHIISHYEGQLRKLSQVSLSSNIRNRQFSWCFGDFELNKRKNHLDFIKQNKRLLVSYLNNGIKETVYRYSDDDLDNQLAKAEIIKNKDYSYFITPISSIVTFGHSAFLNKAEDALQESKDLFKQEGVYDQELFHLFKYQMLFGMQEYLRYFELTFIKKHFLTQLLDDISKNSYKTLKEFNELRKNLNFLILKYDEDILFQSEGSQKELYKAILDKTNVNQLQSKADSMIKNIREDVQNQREAEIKSNEILILIISSLLTITLGYRGIKAITYDIFINLPLIGKFIIQHPLRYTVGIWLILVGVMVWLNLKRWLVNRK